MLFNINNLKKYIKFCLIIFCIFKINNSFAINIAPICDYSSDSNNNFNILYDGFFDDAWKSKNHPLSFLEIKAPENKKIFYANFLIDGNIDNYTISEYDGKKWVDIDKNNIKKIDKTIIFNGVEKVKISVNDYKENLKIKEIRIYDDINDEKYTKKYNFNASKSDVLIVLNNPNDEIEKFGSIINKLTKENKNVSVAYISKLNNNDKINAIINLELLGNENYPLFCDLILHNINKSKYEQNLIKNKILNLISIVKPDIIITYNDNEHSNDDFISQTIIKEHNLSADPYKNIDIVRENGIFDVKRIFTLKSNISNKYTSIEEITQKEIVYSDYLNLRYSYNKYTDNKDIFSNIDIYDNLEEELFKNIKDKHKKENLIKIFEDKSLSTKDSEFIYEDDNNGLWKYISKTLNITIIRKEDKENKMRWYEAEIFSDVNKKEIFKSVASYNDLGKIESSHPVKTAQKNNIIFAMNADYYSYRQGGTRAKGIDIRNKTKIIYDDPYKEKTRRFPNLDILALFDDGNMQVFDGYMYNADYFVKSNANDVFSFGPYLINNYEINNNIYNIRLWDYFTSRIAIGMVKPGHYHVILVEGRIKESKGIDLHNMAKMFKNKGCNVAFNLDGGQTAVMIFMGNQINKIGEYNGKTSPRYTREVLGIGHSDKVSKTYISK